IASQRSLCVLPEISRSVGMPPYGGNVLVSVASTTPGSAFTLGSNWLKKRCFSAAVLYWPLGNGSRATRKLCGLNPRSTVCSATKVRIMTPAPVNSTSESASSTMTSAFRSRPRRKPPLTPRPESFSGPTIFRRLPLVAGLGLGIFLDELSLARRVPWISASLAACYAAFYFAAGQHAASFVPYLRGAFATMSGYSAGMALDGPALDAIAGAYGHQAGDMVLQALAGLLRRYGRKDDVIARFGGEEFCALLVETDPDGAKLAGERIREAAAAFAFDVGRAEPLKITVSVGYASFPLHGEDGNQLVARADLALYAAKHGGRDQVRGYETGLEMPQEGDSDER